MSTISASASFPAAQDLWGRFLGGVDRNKDGTISAEELAALSSTDKAEKIVTQHDAIGDGQLSSDELPKGAFSPQMLGSLLDAQEYRDATPEARAADDTRAIEAMFARADVDGDGVLSEAEWDAERTLNMSSWVDTRQMPDIAFIARTRSMDGLSTVAVPGEEEAPAGLRPEDFIVGRRVALELVAAEDLPDDWSAQLAELKRVTESLPEEEQPQLAVLDEATVRADMLDTIKAQPMTATFLTRLLMSLGGETA